MEIVTQSPLTPEELRNEVAHIIAWLRDMNFAQVEVMHGFGCGSSEAEWLPANVALGSLGEWVASSVEEGIFIPGHSDLWIATEECDADDNPKVQFRICHEADIHVISANLEFLDTVKAHWLDNGWSGYQGVGGKNREWTRFS